MIHDPAFKRIMALLATILIIILSIGLYVNLVKLEQKQEKKETVSYGLVKMAENEHVIVYELVLHTSSKDTRVELITYYK